MIFILATQSPSVHIKLLFSCVMEWKGMAIVINGMKIVTVSFRPGLSYHLLSVYSATSLPPLKPFPTIPLIFLHYKADHDSPV